MILSYASRIEIMGTPSKLSELLEIIYEIENTNPGFVEFLVKAPLYYTRPNMASLSAASLANMFYLIYKYSQLSNIQGIPSVYLTAERALTQEDMKAIEFRLKDICLWRRSDLQAATDALLIQEEASIYGLNIAPAFEDREHKIEVTLSSSKTPATAEISRQELEDVLKTGREKDTARPLAQPISAEEFQQRYRQTFERAGIDIDNIKIQIITTPESKTSSSGENLTEEFLEKFKAALEGERLQGEVIINI